MSKYNPTKFNEIDYEKMITKEVNADRLINALLLAHGFIEAYLRDWLFYVGDIEKKSLNDTDLENFDRISFKNILTIHNVINSFDYKLYKRINELNESRNEFAHELISIDLTNEKKAKELKKAIKNGLFALKQVKNKYDSYLSFKEEEAKAIYFDDDYIRDSRD